MDDEFNVKLNLIHAGDLGSLKACFLFNAAQKAEGILDTAAVTLALIIAC